MRAVATAALLVLGLAQMTGDVLGWGALLLLGFHLLVTVGWAATAPCSVRRPDDALCEWVRRNVLVAGQLVTFAAWALLTWSYWLPLRRTELDSGDDGDANGRAPTI